MFQVNESTVLMPEVTNCVRGMGIARLGCNKVYYVARCFRDESNTGAEGLKELTQIGVELLGENSLDCRKIVRRDAVALFGKILQSNEWILEDGVERGLNLYDNAEKTFEITSVRLKKQLLGGGPYNGGAGWALGLERLILAKQVEL